MCRELSKLTELYTLNGYVLLMVTKYTLIKLIRVSLQIVLNFFF